MAYRFGMSETGEGGGAGSDGGTGSGGEDAPSVSMLHALERLASLRGKAADALQRGDVTRAAAMLERIERIERELFVMVGARPSRLGS